MELKRWQKGVGICFENVNQLVVDAKILIDNGSFGHAVFLLLTAFEEIAVAYYIMNHFENPQPHELNKKRFLNHFKKISYSRFYTFLMSGDFEFFEDYYNIIKGILANKKKKDNIKTFRNELITLEKKIQTKDNIWDLRNNSLYVSLNPINNEYITPQKINPKIAQSILYKIQFIVMKLNLDKELVDKFGSKSLQFDMNDLKFLHSYMNFNNILRAFHDNDNKKLYQLTKNKPELRNILIKLKTKPNQFRISENLNSLITLLLKEFAINLKNIIKKEDNKEQLNYIMDFFNKKNKLLTESLNLNIKILVDIAEEKFKIENYPKLYDYLINAINKKHSYN